MISATIWPTRTRARSPIGTIEVIGASKVVVERAVGLLAGEGDVPGVDGEVDAPGRCLRAPGCGAAVEEDLCETVPRADGGAGKQACSGEGRDERIGRGGHELGCRPGLEEPAVDDDADRVSERCGVFEVVRDDDRGKVEVAKVLVELEADCGLGVGVECGEWFVEEEDVGVACERSGKPDALAFAAGEVSGVCVAEVADAEAVEHCVGELAVEGAEADVLRHVEVGEERVFLEEVADASFLGREVVTTAGVEPGDAVDA